MDKNIIRQGFDAAEKEHQEQQIQQIKNIVQTTLEKIENKSEQRAKLDKEIQLLKKDIDDLKAGRLDRMEERQQKDEEAKRLAIVIITRVEREFIPYKPWLSPYQIVWNISGTAVTAHNLATGTMFQNFTSGTYQIGDRTINL